MYISRPSWVYCAATLLALLYTLKIYLTLDTPVWGLAAPTRYAAWRLTTARSAPGLTVQGCASSESFYWTHIVRDPDAATWFAATLREAATPAGRLLALVGLQGTDPEAFTLIRRTLQWPVKDSIWVHGPPLGRAAYGTEILDSLDTGRLLRALRASADWWEC